MKGLLVIICILLLSVGLLAIAVVDMPSTVRQPDDNKVALFISGDEFHNWAYQEVSGEKYTIIQDSSTHYWCWATIDKRGNLASTGHPVHLTDPRSLRLRPNINISEEKYQELREPFDTLLETYSTRTVTTGNMSIPTIFITFSDQNEFNEPFSYFDEILNDPNTAPASLYRYYKEQSYNTLFVNSFFPLQDTSDAIISYQAPNNRIYYQRGDNALRELLTGCLLAKQQEIEAYINEHNIDVDTDDDGLVDNITFVLVGDEISGSNYWSQHSLLGDNIDLGGSIVSHYTINMEGQIDKYGVSIFAHELGHTLGLPDFKGIDLSGIAKHPVGNWCLMGLVLLTDGDPKNPPSILMHNKLKYCKWIDDIPVINSNATYTLYPNYPDIGREKAYRINSSYSIDEYYIVEYRKNNDPYIDGIIYGTGMLIYKVNSLKKGDESYYFPKDYEIIIYRPSVEPYDGQGNPNPPDPNYDSITANQYHKYAHYSADVGRTEINDSTIPSGRLSDRRYGGLNISDIGYAGETIQFTVSFQFDEYIVPSPAYPDIQTAIDSLSSGMRSIITISSGVYEDNYVINGKDMVIRGVTPDVTISGYFTVNNVPNQIEFQDLMFTTASQQYSINLNNSNAKIDGVNFDLIETDALGAVKALYNNNPTYDKLVIDNSNFLGKQAIDYRSYNSNSYIPSYLIIKSSQFTENNNTESTIGNAVTFEGTDIEIANSIFLQKGLTATGSTIRLHFNFYDNGRYLNVVNNIFKTIVNPNTGSIVQSDFLIDLYTHKTIKINFERNVFHTVNELSSLISISNRIQTIIPVYYIPPNVNIFITNNTDIVTGLYGDYTFLDHKGILLAKNNVLTGCISSQISWGVTNEIRNSCLVPNNSTFTPTFPTIPTYNITKTGNITAKPNIDIQTYTPIWSTSIKSPLIDAGYIGADSLSNNWITNPEYVDSDKTRIDIGAIPTQSHGNMRYLLKSKEPIDGIIRNAIYWVCFPYIDKLFQGTFDGQPADGLEYNLNIYNDNNLFNLYDQNGFIPLKTITWNYNSDQGSFTIGSNSGWAGGYPRLHSRYGYKINMQGLKDADIVVSGFHPSFYNDNSDVITINAINPSVGYRDIWVGYFQSKSEHPLTALNNIVNKLIMIQTKSWTLSRASTTDAWLGVGNQLINPGEAVVLRYVGETPSSFRWIYFHQIPEEEEEEDGGGTTGNFYSHPLPIHFDFEEQYDYIPLFIELSEDMQDDYNAEIGLFIDDVCYGSEVVVGESIQLNAYICEVDIPDDAVVELKYYKYGTKGAGKAINDYRVKGIHDKSFTTKMLNFSHKEHFYQISYRGEGEQQAVIIPIRTSLQGNYPNPFNPSTAIQYSLGEAGKVKISVYNIRGQLVRTLVNELKDAGHHSVVWNGDDSRDKTVSSGIYFYRMETKTGTFVKKMLLLK